MGNELSRSPKVDLEVAGANLGDKRLTDRMEEMVCDAYATYSFQEMVTRR